MWLCLCLHVCVPARAHAQEITSRVCLLVHAFVLVHVFVQLAFIATCRWTTRKPTYKIGCWTVGASQCRVIMRNGKSARKWLDLNVAHLLAEDRGTHHMFTYLYLPVAEPAEHHTFLSPHVVSNEVGKPHKTASNTIVASFC